MVRTMKCKMHVIAKCHKEEELEACRIKSIWWLIGRDKKESNAWRKDVKSITIGKDEKILSLCDNEIEHIDEVVCEKKEFWSKSTCKAKVVMHNRSICG